MSMIIDGTNGLTFNNATTQNSGGKVLQVIQGTTTSSPTTTGTTLIDTGLSATITPLFSTSKILVMTYEPETGRNAGGSYIQLSLQRNGTQIAYVSRYGLNDTTAPSVFQTQCFNVLDAPATTSSVTYKVQFALGTSGGTAFHNVDGNLATITLMEIAQ